MATHETNKPLTAYWLEHYVRRQMCSLCGQSGILDTRATAITTTGLRCGEVHFCICPNGQAMRASGIEARSWQADSWRRSEEG